MAYAVWYIEKEFHVGPIYDTYPMLKFWNLLDEYNIDKYSTSQKKHMKSENDTQTFGG